MTSVRPTNFVEWWFPAEANISVAGTFGVVSITECSIEHTKQAASAFCIDRPYDVTGSDGRQWVLTAGMGSEFIGWTQDGYPVITLPKGRMIEPRVVLRIPESPAA